MHRKSPSPAEAPKSELVKSEPPQSNPSDAAQPAPVTKPKPALSSSLNFALRKIKQKSDDK